MKNIAIVALLTLALPAPATARVGGTPPPEDPEEACWDAFTAAIEACTEEHDEGSEELQECVDDALEALETCLDEI